jgi:hypothetical protein
LVLTWWVKRSMETMKKAERRVYTKEQNIPTLRRDPRTGIYRPD